MIRITHPIRPPPPAYRTKGAQNELYSSVWALQLDSNHFWDTILLPRFAAICGPKLAHFQGPFALERGQNCSTWAQNGLLGTCLCTPNSPKVSLQEHIFDPFLTDLWSQNSPFSIHFVTLEWPKWLAMGSKRAHSTCLGTPNGRESFLEKHVFDPFITHFLVAKQPIFKAFCDFGGAKMTCNGLKMGSFHLFRHPKWSRIIFGKTLS